MVKYTIYRGGGLFLNFIHGHVSGPYLNFNPSSGFVSTVSHNLAFTNQFSSDSNQLGNSELCFVFLNNDFFITSICSEGNIFVTIIINSQFNIFVFHGRIVF